MLRARLFTVGFLVLAQSALASEFRLLELDYVGMEGWKTGFLRDPYIPNYTTGNSEGNQQWLGGASIMWNLSLLEFRPDWKLFWRNRVHANGIPAAVKEVGWEWDLGARVGPYIELFHHHHSRHVLDESSQTGYRFPVRDDYGVRFNLYKRKDASDESTLLTQ